MGTFAVATRPSHQSTAHPPHSHTQTHTTLLTPATTMPAHSKNYVTTPVDGLPQRVSIADLWNGQEVEFTYISPKGKSELVTKKVVDINRETEVVTFLWKTGEVFPVPVSVAQVQSLSVLPTSPVMSMCSYSLWTCATRRSSLSYTWPYPSMTSTKKCNRKRTA